MVFYKPLRIAPLSIYIILFHLINARINIFIDVNFRGYILVKINKIRYVTLFCEFRQSVIFVRLFFPICKLSDLFCLTEKNRVDIINLYRIHRFLRCSKRGTITLNIKSLRKKLNKDFGGRFSVEEKDGVRTVSGESADWNEIVAVCSAAADKKHGLHVVNDIRFTGAPVPEMRLPEIRDKSLDGAKPDVMIIGGGISGASIARELTKNKLDILLVDKESDLAMQASGRNDGEVHPGIDLSKGSLKHKYIIKGNRMFDKICAELDVPFKRCGQYVCFDQKIFKPLVRIYVWKRKHIDGIDDSVLISGEELKRREPNFNKDFCYAIYNPMAGCVCPYGLTIAYGENAVMNGAKISLNTAVTGMEVKDGKIISVETNRGTVYPKIVINAAGVFAEDIAKMAGDRFYSIHPRRGTNSILDKKAGSLMSSIASIKKLELSHSHTKGGGLLNTVHGNILAGPDAVETYEKENFATNRESINTVFAKQRGTAPDLTERDIITYFTGVRAPNFEEDFVIEKGRKTANLIHCACIQSPGLTTAPAVALDIEKMAVEMLGGETAVKKNPNYNPIRKGVPVLREMSESERAEMIKKNPDYGEIVCRCEEISKGEITDALNSPLCVPTVDGIKKRLRPGMGRCQGGFCSPLVTKIIAEHQGIPVSQVRKSGSESVISYGKTKGGELE